MELTNSNLMEEETFSNFDLESYETSKKTATNVNLRPAVVAKPMVTTVTPEAPKPVAVVPPTPQKQVAPSQPIPAKRIGMAQPIPELKKEVVKKEETKKDVPMEENKVVEAINDKLCQCQDTFDLMLKNHYKKMIVLCVVGVVAVLGGTVILKRTKLI